MKYLLSAAFLIMRLLVMITLLSACSTRSPATNFYLLENELSAKQYSGELRIGLGPVEVADYLQKPQIALRTDSSQIKFAEFDRWASSLRGLIINALQHDLAKQLNTNNIYEYPWRQADQVDYSMSIDIKRLDASFKSGEAYLEAKSIIKDHDDNSFVETISLSQDLESNSFDALVKAERQLLLYLSEQLSLAIQRLEDGQRP